MGLLDSIKSILGLNASERSPSIEHDRIDEDESTLNERMVKESPAPESSSEGSTDNESPTETESSQQSGTEPATASESVEEIKGIGPAYSERLASVGVSTVSELASANAAELAEQTDLGEGRLEEWIERARAR